MLSGFRRYKQIIYKLANTCQGQTFRIILRSIKRPSILLISLPIIDSFVWVDTTSTKRSALGPKEHNHQSNYELVNLIKRF